ncbi:PREDICTED: proline synthase co-transcribed bacterial homolog protein-like [Rhagoletis zephyria]|uniref:proline synthase co-transcribed bacterial homolog protein-like n=1 Tax=Rhagoletis zephyria TaxID=28612 RepID=UPI000811AAAB|nr:PREDICTED: proline synthase co-transcribed bacterial homolog protein-like [Rhagoletis zephyria]
MEHLNFISDNLADVNSKIDQALAAANIPNKKRPCLVAVSKTQPKEYVIQAYKCGQRHFGENYIQELNDKANDQEIITQCPEIKWHIIGHIQTNKINKLLASPNLSVIETIDSVKLAEAINEAIKRNDLIKGTIDVFVQVNTSNEEAKSGIDPEHLVELVEFITTKCDRLHFVGFMTIGAYGYDVSLGPNPDFLKLLEVRETFCKKANVDQTTIELSMGMSCDYEHAIHLGSTFVRVGTGIFGPRKAKV